MKRSSLWRFLSVLIIIILASAALLTGCSGGSDYDPLDGVETIVVHDDAGRDVEIPADISRIAPSGSTATMMLIPLATDLLVGISASPSVDQEKYLPEELLYLPTFGQFYGSKSTLNMEALIEAQPQVIFDLGDKKATVKEDMDQIQKQTGIPTLFFDGTLDHMADTYRTLGQILNKEEQAEKIAEFIDRTTEMAHRNSEKIPEEDRVRILYGTGATGLAVNADGSSQAQVIDFIGAANAVIPDKVTNKGGGTIVSLESLYADEPDAIILTRGGPYSELKESEWSELKAVREERYYEIPGEPYCWMSGPPSVNMILGVWWLGQLIYPEIYNDYDMADVAREYYDLFWHYDLTEDEAKEMLAGSYYR